MSNGLFKYDMLMDVNIICNGIELQRMNIDLVNTFAYNLQGFL